MNDNETKSSDLLDRLKSGDSIATAQVFHLYAQRLIKLAHSRLNTQIRQKVDPEDVVQSVFRSFFRRQQEEFTVRDEHHLWNLLALITACKCKNIKIYWSRQIRDIGREVHLDFTLDDSFSRWETLSSEPDSYEADCLNQLIEELILSLPKLEQRIVTLAFEGKSTQDISKAVGRAGRTVRRVLQHFRQKLINGTREHSGLAAASHT